MVSRLDRLVPAFMATESANSPAIARFLKTNGAELARLRTQFRLSDAFLFKNDRNLL